MNEMTDQELIAASCSHDEEAFAVLLGRHLDAVYWFAYRYVREREDANDIAQEAFVRAWKSLKTFDQSKNFKTWIFAIAKNAALDLLRKKKPLLFSRISEEEEALDAFLAPYASGEGAPDAVFERLEMKANVAYALDKLPAAYRRVLTMRYHESLKFREIAEALGQPIDTVKSRHRRGVALMRKIMVG